MPGLEDRAHPLCDDVVRHLVEWIPGFFGSQGLAAITAFRKSVDSFITEVTEAVFVMDQAGGRFGPVQRPINGEGGEIELSVLGSGVMWWDAPCESGVWSIVAAI